MADPQPSPQQLVSTAVVIEGGMGIVAVLVGWPFGLQILQQVHFVGRDILIGIAAALPMLAVMWILLKVPLASLKQLRQVLGELVVPMFQGASLLDLAVVSVAAGVGEELLFRGLVQGGLTELGGPVSGLLLGSLLFGLAHPITRMYVLVAGLFGLCLGGLWMWTGNLLAPILTHALYDFLALVYLLRTSNAESAADAAAESDQPQVESPDTKLAEQPEEESLR